jgi:CBS domain containing-hemolysin-like protein
MKYSLKHSSKWSLFISIVTFFLASVFTVASTTLLEGLSWGLGMLIVILLVLNGIFFDIMGIAATAASEVPFHGMASERVKGSKKAIYIVRNADRFSNFCNDVVGDVSSVISGAASAAVVFKLMESLNSGNEVLRVVVSVVFTALVSALTVGGKAMGKSFAIHYSTDIVLMIGKVFDMMEKRFKIKVFNPKKKKKPKTHQGKRGDKRARTNQSA